MFFPTPNNDSSPLSLASDCNSNTQRRGRSLKRVPVQLSKSNPVTSTAFSASLATSPYLSGPIRAKASKSQPRKKNHLKHENNSHQQHAKRSRGKSPYSVPTRLSSPPTSESFSMDHKYYQSDNASVKKSSSRRTKKKSSSSTVHSANMEETVRSDDEGYLLDNNNNNNNNKNNNTNNGYQRQFLRMKSPYSAVPSSPFGHAGFSPYAGQQDSMSCSGLSRIGSRSTLRSRERKNNLVVRTVLLPSEVDEMLQDYKQISTNTTVVDHFPGRKDNTRQEVSNMHVLEGRKSADNKNDDSSTIGSEFAQCFDDEGVLVRYGETIDAHEADYLYRQFENFSTLNNNQDKSNHNADAEYEEPRSEIKLPPVGSSLELSNSSTKTTSGKGKLKPKAKSGKRKVKKKQ